MMPSRRLLVLAFASLLVGCGARVHPVTAPQTSPLPVRPFTGINTPTITLTLDTTTLIVARADAEFAAGQSELTLGHRAAARDRFDAAVDAFLAAPGGARSEPRLEAAFDQMLDRIGARESLELRAGDGFAEARSEPAVIDSLLAMGTAELSSTPARTTAEIVAADLATTKHDVPIQVNDKVLSYI